MGNRGKSQALGNMVVYLSCISKLLRSTKMYSRHSTTEDYLCYDTISKKEFLRTKKKKKTEVIEYLNYSKVLQESFKLTG